MSNINYDKYLNLLMRKQPSKSNSELHTQNIQNGGLKTDGSIPFGGFPPIYLCSRDNTLADDENKNREYSTHKTAVSIKDIMKKRRDIVPFITT